MKMEDLKKFLAVIEDVLLKIHHISKRLSSSMLNFSIPTISGIDPSMLICQVWFSIVSAKLGI